MCDDPAVAELVSRARNGDNQAWDAIVERYAPLIWSICRRHRLGDADAQDVGQRVWLQLVDQLHRLRDPAALPGWPPVLLPGLGPRPDSPRSAIALPPGWSGHGPGQAGH
jgi:Sigma-70 region 2